MSTRSKSSLQVRFLLGLTDYYQVDTMILRCKPVNIGTSKVDMLGLWYKSVNFGAEESPGSPHWRSLGLAGEEITINYCPLDPLGNDSAASVRLREREFFIDNPLVRIHFIIVIITLKPRVE